MMQHPILSNRSFLYLYTGVWSLLTLFHVLLIVLSQHFSIGIAFPEGLITNVFYAIIGLGLWYFVYYGKTTSYSKINFIIYHVFACLITVGLWMGISYIILTSLFSYNEGYIGFLNRSLPWRAGIGTLYFGLIILVYYLIIYYLSFKENLIKEAELKTLVKESELNSLKSQINPHFLFNSLNSISSLTMIHPEKAQEMIIKLADFLRYSISNKDEKLTSLNEEIRNINRYLDIEKIRFGKRLIVSQNLNESCLELKLPGLILQPLVENAIKYGVYENTETTSIEINCRCSQELLIVNIKNEYDPDFQYKKGEGIGLQNIKNRLRILYSRNDLIDIKKDEKYFEVEVLFPQIKND